MITFKKIIRARILKIKAANFPIFIKIYNPKALLELLFTNKSRVSFTLSENSI